MAVKKKSQNGNKQQQHTGTGTDKLFDNLNPNNLLNNAQRVINSAVNVLEEEIAAGILAAKRIEKKVINVDEVRDDSQNLMNRIRKDTHEALDIFLDALAALSKQVGLLTESVAKETKTAAKKETATREENNSVQIIAHDKPATPGSEITFSILLSDNDIKKPVFLEFQKADFTGPANQKVLARNIRITPSTFTLNPGEEKEIAIAVKLPKICAPGSYNSILAVNQMPAVKIILCFEVK